jgi:hypothetical protein
MIFDRAYQLRRMIVPKPDPREFLFVSSIGMKYQPPLGLIQVALGCGIAQTWLNEITLKTLEY